MRGLFGNLPRDRIELIAIFAGPVRSPPLLFSVQICVYIDRNTMTCPIISQKTPIDPSESRKTSFQRKQYVSYPRVFTFLLKSLFNFNKAIAELKLHVLLYADIGMDPFTYFLTYARLAPVQAVTHGHPCTTGVPEIDFFVRYPNIL